MSDNIFMNWLETELAMKEREDMVKRKKKEIEVPTITDLQLVLTNRVKTLVSDINDSGIDYVTYSDISILGDEIAIRIQMFQTKLFAYSI